MTHWLGIISVLLPALALFGTWMSWRRSELRRDDVLVWGNDAIAALETILLICIDEENHRTAPNPRMDDLRYRTAILVEQGRLFFRNKDPHRHGGSKQSAYRGLRPCILDPLVVAHQIATAWPTADPADRAGIRMIAESRLKSFVSLLQKEVGRDRTASAETGEGGDGATLRHLLSQLERERAHSPG